MTVAELAADKTMCEIWSEWFAFYQKHFRGNGITISAADQMAFYEIAQPKLFALVRSQNVPRNENGKVLPEKGNVFPEARTEQECFVPPAERAES